MKNTNWNAPVFLTLKYASATTMQYSLDIHAGNIQNYLPVRFCDEMYPGNAENFKTHRLG